jgi:hypothetical protein
MENRVRLEERLGRAPAAAGTRTDLSYNYASFHFDLEAEEIKRWRRVGPRPGSPAPLFELEATDGTSTRLGGLRGRPVVIEFGSYTCPSFCGHIRAMEQLARVHREASFLVVYSREAHPGENVDAHRSSEEKLLQALRLKLEEQVARPVLVDDWSGRVHRAYGGGWNPVFVLDRDGRVVLRRFWNDPTAVEFLLRGMARGRVPPREALDYSPPALRKAAGLELLERGGERALLDVYRSAPAPTRSGLDGSGSPAVRAVLAQAARSAPSLH